MTNEEITKRLEKCGIRTVRDVEVPVNGVVQPVPYLVMLPKTTVIGSDNGRVSLHRTDWQLILMTAERDDGLTNAVLETLRGCPKATVERFPDLNPYQTTFKFTTFDM